MHPECPPSRPRYVDHRTTRQYSHCLAVPLRRKKALSHGGKQRRGRHPLTVGVTAASKVAQRESALLPAIVLFGGPWGPLSFGNVQFSMRIHSILVPLTCIYFVMCRACDEPTPTAISATSIVSRIRETGGAKRGAKSPHEAAASERKPDPKYLMIPNG